MRRLFRRWQLQFWVIWAMAIGMMALDLKTDAVKPYVIWFWLAMLALITGDAIRRVNDRIDRMEGSSLVERQNKV